MSAIDAPAMLVPKLSGTGEDLLAAEQRVLSQSSREPLSPLHRSAKSAPEGRRRFMLSSIAAAGAAAGLTAKNAAAAPLGSVQRSSSRPQQGPGHPAGR